MSAICGIIHFNGKPVEKSDLETMVESSPNRGLDGTSFHLDRNAGFAHLAFHVTPESVHERQPLVSEDGRLVLVADVRLDNREELIDRLDKDNSRMSSLQRVPDSILLMEAYLHWGDKCVDHLLGDFVFAVWDRESQELFLARDSLGGYSVTWHRVGQTLVFASETTAILDLPFVEPKIKKENVAKVLAHVPRGPEETFFESIYFLPAAHTLRASAKRLEVRKYWDIDPDHRIEYRSEMEYAEHFLGLVDQAVLCRMRSIKPVGIALSGGHDSSLLAACAARNRSGSDPVHDRINSFSYIFDRYEVADERLYINAVVDRLGLEPTYVVADDMWTFRDIAEKPVQRDYLWTNSYAQLPLSLARAAGNAGCRLLIDGQFGDAFCSGNSLFASELLRQGRIATLFSILRRHGDELEWREELFSKGIRPLLPAWLRRSYRKFVPSRLEPFIRGLDAAWIQRLQDTGSAGHIFGVMSELSPTRRQRYGYLMNSSWSHGFGAVRGPTYGRFAVERVSPYFDRRIVEYIMAVPGEQLAFPGHYRRLQTNAMKLVLPPLVYERRTKAAYEPLIQQGLLVKEKGVVRELVEDAEMVDQGWVNREWLEEQLAAGKDWDMGGYAFSMCLHLELWLRAIDEVQKDEVKWATPYKYRPRNSEAGSGDLNSVNRP